MATDVDYFIAQNKGVSPHHLWKTTVLNPSEPEGRVRAPVGCQPWHPGEACGRPVLCWGERLGVAEARMEQALGTCKVCLADVLIPAGPSQAAPAARTPILQATHTTVSCWVPFIFLMRRQTSTKYTPLHYPLQGS